MRPSLVVLASLVGCAPSSSDGSVDSDTGESSTPSPSVEEALTLDGLLQHLEALQAIANDHAGNRAGETSGYLASVDYAEEVLRAAGYEPRRIPFAWKAWTRTGPASLEAGEQAYTDVRPLWYSPSGDLVAPLTAVDLVLPPTPTSSSTSGCDMADFAGFPAGHVALIQRGTCTFGEKVAYAQAAGASAVVVFNEGQPGRQSVEDWALSSEDDVGIPVLGASFAVGSALAAALDEGPVEVRLIVQTDVVQQESFNLIADTSAGDPDRTVVIGAHLDSVYDGPGINDNGSGTALVLELARLVGELEVEPRNRLRFALWGAEELGLVGSLRYLSSLSEGEIDGILANLNYDMVGSPNGVRYVYDGDGSAWGIAGPEGSALIEALHTEWFEAHELPWEETPFDGRSDYYGFIARGIPAGGLFSGAEGTKSAEEAELHGGQVGRPHDPCYHRPCDTLDNIDPELLFELSRAAAHATARLGDFTAPLQNARRGRTPRNASPGPLPGVPSCHGDRPAER